MPYCSFKSSELKYSLVDLKPEPGHDFRIIVLTKKAQVLHKPVYLSEMPDPKKGRVRHIKSLCPPARAQKFITCSCFRINRDCIKHAKCQDYVAILTEVGFRH